MLQFYSKIEAIDKKEQFKLYFVIRRLIYVKIKCLIFILGIIIEIDEILLKYNIWV